MRTVHVSRKTKETKINLVLNLDGKGKYKIDTSIPFLDHMLSLFALHGKFNLRLSSTGDRQIDDHHLVEDIGLVLGEAVDRALGNKKGIQRYGNFLVPMDEALAYVVIDISGRPYLKYNVKFNRNYKWLKSEFNYCLIEDFFYGFASTAKITLHVSVKSGRSNHHIAESVFKGFGKGLARAVKINLKRKNIPSTKGKL